MKPGERVDRFIRAVLTRGLGEQAARIFAMDAMTDYAAGQVAERDAEWRKALIAWLGSDAVEGAKQLAGERYTEVRALLEGK